MSGQTLIAAWTALKRVFINNKDKTRTSHQRLPGDQFTKEIQTRSRRIHPEIMEKRMYDTIVRDKSDGIHQQLLPTAVASLSVARVQYATATTFEVDNTSNMEDSDSFVHPTHIQNHHPGPKQLASDESRRIHLGILNGSGDGRDILISERQGYIAAARDANQISNDIRQAIKSSVYVDNLDANFSQQDRVRSSSFNSRAKEDALMEEDMKRAREISTASTSITGSEGYKMTEYKSVYETEGTYKIKDYKSIYDK